MQGPCWKYKLFILLSPHCSLESHYVMSDCHKAVSKLGKMLFIYTDLKPMICVDSIERHSGMLIFCIVPITLFGASLHWTCWEYWHLNTSSNNMKHLKNFYFNFFSFQVIKICHKIPTRIRWATTTTWAAVVIQTWMGLVMMLALLQAMDLLSKISKFSKNYILFHCIVPHLLKLIMLH